MAVLIADVGLSAFCVLLILLYANIYVSAEMQPVIESMSLVNTEPSSDTDNSEYRELLIEFWGCNFNTGMQVILTSKSAPKGSVCMNEDHSVSDGYKLHLNYVNQTFARMTLNLPIGKELMWKGLYACVKSAVRTRGFRASDCKHNQNSETSRTLNSTFGGEVIKWIHQGEIVVLRSDNISHGNVRRSDRESYKKILVNQPIETVVSAGKFKRRHVRSMEPAKRSSGPGTVRIRRQNEEDGARFGHNYTANATARDESGKVVLTLEEGSAGQVFGLRIERASRDPAYDEHGVPSILAESDTTVRLFGFGFTNVTKVSVTSNSGNRGDICYVADGGNYVEDVTDYSALVTLRLASMKPGQEQFFVCLLERGGSWVHQGSDLWLQVRSYERLLPLWLQITILVCLLVLSGLFSGLNLGLMSLDRTELKIINSTGSQAERRYAQAIIPLRNHGNYLLCSLLLGNVLVNSTLTILMDDLTSGLIAIIMSTLAIVIFGEIIPQAICSRHGLAVGAKTVYVTRLFMLITFPLSYPISLILDRILGEEIGCIYNRERLKELVKLTTEYNDLEKEEVNIIAGALELKKKTVGDVMTKLEDAFMLSYDSILDFETVSDIMKQGYSRVPVYEGERLNVIALLYIKDLAFVDPDDNTPLKTLCQFYQNPCNFVFEDTTLDIMFKEFKEGNKGHLAFVQRVNSEGEGDPFYETIGLVTLEDVIEELIQAEIMDETDIWTDNRSKRRRDHGMKQDFTVFAERRENQRIHISPQLTLATFQYLSTTVDAFKPELISETILRRLLKQDVIFQIKVKSKEKARADHQTVIYQQGKPTDCFVLILEGRVEVTVGRENMTFESGPFTYFGSQALSQVFGGSPTSVTPQGNGSIQSVNLDALVKQTFVPDYTVRAVTDVFYVRIKRSLYLAAKRATLMERCQKDVRSEDDHFEKEIEKLLHSLEDDDRSRASMDSAVLGRIISDTNFQSQVDPEVLRHRLSVGERVSLKIDSNALSSLPNTPQIISPAHSGDSNTSPVALHHEAVVTAQNGSVKMNSLVNSLANSIHSDDIKLSNGTGDTKTEGNCDDTTLITPTVMCRQQSNSDEFGEKAILLSQRENC